MSRGGFLRSRPSSHFPFESVPCLRREAPEHHVQRLHLVYTEAPVSIVGIDPQLPIFLRPAAALIGDVVDSREQRGGAAAAVTEGYAMRAVLGRVHHIENRAALRPGKVGDGLDHAVAIVLALCACARWPAAAIASNIAASRRAAARRVRRLQWPAVIIESSSSSTLSFV